MAIPLPSEASCISKANFSEKVPLFEDLAEDTNHFKANANCFSFFRGKGICCVLPAIRTDLISKRGLTLFTDFENVADGSLLYLSLSLKPRSLISLQSLFFLFSLLLFLYLH